MPNQVDVLVPAFNASATIRASLASILAQEELEFRIIVVDDGSTDDTLRIVSEMAAEDGRIHLIAAQHGGIVEALNAGLLHCNAPYVARHDADDFAFKNRLAEQCRFLEAHPDCVAVGCRAHVIDSAGQRTGQVTFFQGPAQGDLSWVPAREPYIMHPFLMLRRETLVAVGGYRHVLHAEDSDLYWRLLRLGKLYNMDAILGEYRLHAQGVSSASVTNGRAGAVFSQLAALSARRHAQNLPDLAFSSHFATEVGHGMSLACMIDRAGKDLSVMERRDLALSGAAKFLELSSYRSFRPEVADFRTIRDTFREQASRLSPANRRVLAAMYATGVTRCVARGCGLPPLQFCLDPLFIFGITIFQARKLLSLIARTRTTRNTELTRA